MITSPSQQAFVKQEEAHKAADVTPVDLTAQHDATPKRVTPTSIITSEAQQAAAQEEAHKIAQGI